MKNGSGHPGILVEGVWKKFRRGERHDSLRDLLPSLVRGLARRRRNPAELEALDFWALRDVSFEVRSGQVLGIIGHNGAGKSTLLKLITRIMRPTLGRCEVRGRVGALIELAAGFHPDLTGRENVFLQGAIMGMPAAVTKRRFDEIVEFSGIGEFIDTPIKRYSSGMNARLGFSLAAHLDPDVLIIDEVLSVGDMAFQERAFNRMQEIACSGIPVAVVSHQLERIAALANRAVLLRKGAVVAIGSPREVITEYVSAQRVDAQVSDSPVPGLVLEAATCENGAPVRSGELARIRLRGRREEGGDEGRSALTFRVKVRRLETGQIVYDTMLHRHGPHVLDHNSGFSLAIDLQMNVPAGVYTVEFLIADAATEHVLSHGPWVHVEVCPSGPFKGNVQLNPAVRIDWDA